LENTYLENVPITIRQLEKKQLKRDYCKIFVWKMKNIQHGLVQRAFSIWLDSK